MNPADLKVPEKGFTKYEREWIKTLIEAIKTVHGIEGRNVRISNTSSGQVIDADNCPPCP